MRRRLASPSLDVEPIAAGEIYTHGSWVPITELSELGDDLSTVGELQGDAQPAANGLLQPDGTISPR